MAHDLDVPLARKVAALGEPGTYPEEDAGPLRAIETHMSWVFLTRLHAYKLKKPIRIGRQDSRTAAARRFYCDEELRINRRLAAPVYLDVVPLAVEEHGRLRVGGHGPAADWLVKMQRLDASLMLDARLACGQATARDMAHIAHRLAAFYKAQEPQPLDAPAYLAGLRERIEAAGRGLCDAAWALSPRHTRPLWHGLRQAVQRHAGALAARVAQGRIVEAHGDLRPEHVYLGQPLAIIDALEFSRELRVQDSADEAGFLALECERAGHAWLAGCLLRDYRDACSDAAPAPLVHLYQALRAAERALLAIRHVREPRHEDPLNWRLRTRRYLALGRWHLAACLAHAQPG